MDYDINALLYKMGLNDLAEQKEIRWCYIDAKNPNVSGNAHARFANDGRKLVVELSHDFVSIDDEDGPFGEICRESIRLEAERVKGSDNFKITELEFDGINYDTSNDAMVQLCCGLFYARALKINEIMIDQKFETEIAEYNSSEKRRRLIAETVAMADNMAGVIVPFRPRQDAPLQRI